MTTTYLTIRQSMKRGMMPAATPDNPMASSQKYMTYIMPFFALTGLYWPFGLVLYWVTTNVWTLGQQWLLGRRYPYTPPATAADGTPAPSSAARSLTGGSAKSLTAGAGKPAAARAQQGGSQVNGSRTAKAAANGAKHEWQQSGWRDGWEHAQAPGQACRTRGGARTARR